MRNPHHYPNYVFTTYLTLAYIHFSRETSDVRLFGCYGNMVDGDTQTIEIETDFVTLNDLPAEAGPEAEEAIDLISKELSDPTIDDPFIDLTDQGGLTLCDHIFAFLLMADVDDDGNMLESDEYHYRLTFHTKRENIVPEFWDCDRQDSFPRQWSWQHEDHT